MRVNSAGYQGRKAATSSANPLLTLLTNSCVFCFQKILGQHKSCFCSLEEDVKSLKHIQEKKTSGFLLPTFTLPHSEVGPLPAGMRHAAHPHPAPRAPA